MASRTWIGGGNNHADNPKDWSPRSVPQPGDQLIIASGTMEIRGDELANIGGLTVAGECTLDLTNATIAGIGIYGSENPPFTWYPPCYPEINLKGTNAFYLGVHAMGSTTVNLAENSEWIGGFSTAGGVHSPYTSSIVINGEAHATFINTGSYIAGTPGLANVINADIGGVGSFDFWYGSLEVGKVVGAGQSFVLSDSNEVLRIDQPKQFAGIVELKGADRIDLMNLAKDDSYTYQNDMLTIYSGNKVIDTLRLLTMPIRRASKRMRTAA
jgi:hypothetical protein